MDELDRPGNTTTPAKQTEMGNYQNRPPVAMDESEDFDEVYVLHAFMYSQTSTKENIFTDKIPLFLLVLFTFVEP